MHIGQDVIVCCVDEPYGPVKDYHLVYFRDAKVVSIGELKSFFLVQGKVVERLNNLVVESYNDMESRHRVLMDTATSISHRKCKDNKYVYLNTKVYVTNVVYP